MSVIEIAGVETPAINVFPDAEVIDAAKAAQRLLGIDCALRKGNEEKVYNCALVYGMLL